MNSSLRNPWLLAAVLTAALGLCGMVAFSPHHLVFDEAYHLEGAQLLARGGTFHDFLVAPLQSVPGPLYPTLHAALAPLTGLQAPAIRWLNIVLLFASMAALARDRSWPLAGMILGVPMVWVTAGMALTEVPAYAMASFAFAAAAWGAREGAARWQCWAGFLVAGLFAGLAIAGRQTYLPILSAFGFIFLFEKRWRWPALLAMLIAIALPLPVFLTWGGLIPKSQAHVGGGIALEHGLLAFAYLGLVAAIVAPRFYAPGWKWTLLAAALGLLANLLVFHVEWAAAASLAKRLPAFLQPAYPRIVGSFLVAAFAGFGVALGVNLWARRDDKFFLLMAAETLLLTATAFGVVHLFSSRYVMNAFPFAILMLQPFFRPGGWAAARLGLGALLGAASLTTYYW